MANVVGSDAQNFNPTTNGIDYVTVQASETLKPGIFNFGLFGNYAVNTLPYFPFADSGVEQNRFDFNDYILATDLNFGMGITDDWDWGLSAPNILAADVENSSGVGLFTTGFTEIRVNTKYRFSGDDEEGGYAGVLSVNFNLIEDNPFSGRGAGPTFNLQFVADAKFGNWALGGNLGYRLRNPGEPIEEVAFDPFPNQFIASVGSSYLLESIDTKLIMEIFSSYPEGNTSENQTDRQLSSAEYIAGLKWDVRQDLAFHAGMGTELVHGASSPDWRVYTGINWVWGREEPVQNVVQETFEEEKIEKIRLPGLNFVTGTADVSPGSEATIEQLVEAVNDVLNRRKVVRVIVEGHTDSVGSDQMNMNLSRYRAETIRNAVIDMTVLTPDQVISEGYGESRPIADNGNYQGRARNRRVEINMIFEE